MIARLTGTLLEAAADHAVLDVAGVGYLVLASTRTLGAIGPVGGDDAVILHIDMQIREDSMTLFGFASGEERIWFRLLTGVQGVGGKVALGILSALDGDELNCAIAGGDAAMVARANGVGPKLAARIVNELKGKVGAMATGNAGVPGVAQDAVSALINLGFRPAEASAAVAKADTELGGGAGLDALVRVALKKVAR